jgi:hypothetical protein
MRKLTRYYPRSTSDYIILRLICLNVHGSHLGWRSWSPDTILKAYYPRTTHAMFALNWLTGFIASYVKTQNTFWLPWFISILICLRVQIRWYALIGRHETIDFHMAWFGFMVFYFTFNNISIISWLSVLLVEETGWSRQNQVTEKL